MKYLIVGLILLSTSPLFASKSSWVDGQIKFDVTFSSDAPSNFELSIATSGMKFDNYTDFVTCVSDKEHLRDKLDDLKPSDDRKNRRTMDYLRSENNKR